MIMFLVSSGCLSPYARLHANFQSNIGSDFYEDSEGDRVNVYYRQGIQNKPK